MHIKIRKAFTITELVFVIVVIGILSAIAIPKFQESSIEAYDTKAKSQIISVMSAIATERQKRILRGDFDPIISLGTGGYAFSTFENGNQDAVVQSPISNCGSGEKGCWTRSGTSYIYTFVDSGTADFRLVNSRLVCDSDDDDCNRLLR